MAVTIPQSQDILLGYLNNTCVYYRGFFFLFVFFFCNKLCSSFSFSCSSNDSVPSLALKQYKDIITLWFSFLPLHGIRPCLCGEVHVPFQSVRILRRYPDLSLFATVQSPQGWLVPRHSRNALSFWTYSFSEDRSRVQFRRKNGEKWTLEWFLMIFPYKGCFSSSLTPFSNTK